jgi:hypothetical protein
MSSTHRPSGARPHAPDRVLGDPLDGRLDLDDLDAPLDLESIGDDHDDPYLSERVRAWLDEKGVLPWVRRHRVVLASASAVALVAVSIAGITYVRRPVPLPAQPRLVLTSSGADVDQVQVDTASRPHNLTLSVVLTSAEARGVTMTLLGLTGPGLVDNPGGIHEEVDPSQPDRALQTTAGIDCSEATTFAAVLAATPASYGVVVRRTSSGGDSRVDTVPLRGGSRLAAVVRQQCVQAAADRQLVVHSVGLTPLPDAVGLDLSLTVGATSGSAWNIERVVADPGSALTSSDGPTYASPERAAVLTATLYPSDCGHPLRDIADGIPVQAAPAGSSIDGGAGTQVLLPLPPDARTRIVELLATQCGTQPVTALIDQVITHEGSSVDSGGTLELRMHLVAPGAFVLPIDDTTTEAGRLHPDESPAAVTDGVATPVITWEVPPCARLARTGVPDLRVRAVVVQGEQTVERPYLLTLGGDELRVGITRLCGDSVAARVLTSVSDPALTH